MDARQELLYLGNAENGELPIISMMNDTVLLGTHSFSFVEAKAGWIAQETQSFPDPS